MGMMLPKQIWLTTGNACNYKCIFCNNRNQQRIPFMPFDMIKELFEYFDENSTFDLSGYGEFLLHPQFNEIIKLTIKKRIGLQLVTNGELLTEEKRNLLKQSNLKLINFSLNSLIDNTKYMLSGDCGHNERVLENFLYFVQQPRDYKVTISMVMTKYNYKEMPVFAQLGIDEAVDMVKFLQLVKNIDYLVDLHLENTDEENLFADTAYKMLKNACVPFIGLRNIELDDPYSYEIKQKNITNCTSPWVQTVIDQNGNVFPCCYLPDYPVGNLNKNNFVDIWNGEKMEKLRSAIKRGCKNEFCKNCMDYK